MPPTHLPADELANSTLAARVPELVAFIVLASVFLTLMTGGFLFWVWRLFKGNAAAQTELIAQLNEIGRPYAAAARDRDDKFVAALKDQQAVFVASLRALEDKRESNELRQATAVERAADKMAAVVADNTRALIEGRASDARVVEVLNRVVAVLARVESRLGPHEGSTT